MVRSSSLLLFQLQKDRPVESEHKSVLTPSRKGLIRAWGRGRTGSGRGQADIKAAVELSFSNTMMLLQPLWSFLRGHAPLLHSPVFPVLFSVSTYLSCCAPFLLLDLLAPRCALVHRYKLQPQSSASLASVRSCLAQTLYNHVVFIFPLTLTHWYLRPAHLPQEAPPLPRLLAQVLVCLLLFDFQSFTWHLLHHRVPWLYRTFHKLHHSSSAPSALTTEHSGSMETLSLGFFAAANPVLLGLHPLSELVFFLLNIWLSVEDHCGYDLPWAPHRLVPLGLYGGARHHDLHHLKSNCNYAPYFTHWDRLAGTLCTLQDD